MCHFSHSRWAAPHLEGREMAARYKIGLAIALTLFGFACIMGVVTGG